MTDSVIKAGPGTHSVPLSLFRDNRQRVCDEIKKLNINESGVYILLQGGDTVPFYDTDTDYVFRQVNMQRSLYHQCIHGHVIEFDDDERPTIDQIIIGHPYRSPIHSNRINIVRC